MNPFDYTKAINEKKSVLHLYEYNPYLTNTAFSYSLDTVMLSNEMNKYHGLLPEAQYDFYYNSVRRGKRYNKWHKKTEHPHLAAVMEYYGYSREKAIQALQVLTQDNIRDILSELDKGGR
jgi:capsule polysaccharide modification protein KpsS